VAFQQQLAFDAEVCWNWRYDGQQDYLSLAKTAAWVSHVHQSRRRAELR
jgi:hypothetical protein